MRFWTGYRYEIPARVERVEYSTTFGCWGAVVTFANGERAYTYPEDRGWQPEGAQSSAEVRASLLAVLRKFVTDGFHKPWHGAEHGKVTVGNALIAAARENGATDEEIGAALRAVRA